MVEDLIQDAVADHGPGPVDLLGPASGLELSGRGQGVAVLEDGVPQFHQAHPLHCAHGENRRPPEGLPRVDQPDRRGEFPGGGLGFGGVRTVGLVDHDDVRQFEDTLLDALELVAGSGQGEEDEGIDHVRYRDLGLSDTDGLHQDDVKTGGLQQDDGLPGGFGHPAEGPRRRGRADVGVRVDRQSRHPGLVPQDRSSGARRRGVDREHRDAVSPFDEVHTECLDGGRLAHPGHPGDPDVHGRTGGADRIGSLHQFHQQLLCLLAMVGAGGLDDGDGPGQRGPVTATDRCGEGRDIVVAQRVCAHQLAISSGHNRAARRAFSPS